MKLAPLLPGLGLLLAACAGGAVKSDDPTRSPASAPMSTSTTTSPTTDRPGAAPVKVRPDVTRATLDNGLEVYMVQDRSAPLVSYQVWFKVGSVNENEAGAGDTHGITGLSHFFEHMMFRGTEKVPDYFAAMASRGIQLNAFTWLDQTVYWENLPSQHLKDVIEIEADRLEHMKVDFLNLEPEREVVKSERLLRVENDPEGKAAELLQSRVFEVFPYHWDTIGWMKDLNAITVEEAQRYHSVYYAPNNAYIVVVGDHDPAQTLQWIQAAYGHLEPRDIPPERFPTEPRQQAARRDRVVSAVDTPMVLWAYRAPPVRERDYAVLQVIDQIMNGGKSSRLQQKFVHTAHPRLGRLQSMLLPIRHPYMYLWSASLEPGMSTRQLERELDASVVQLINEGVTQEELDRAVASLRSSIVRQNLSHQKKAEMIGFSLRASDDPTLFFDRLEVYGQVTQADIQRVAREVLRPDNRTLVPVVNPQRVLGLLDAYVAATPELPAAVREAATQAGQLLLGRWELREQAQALDAEADAIRLLDQRAQRQLAAAATPEDKAAIERYMADNEKGTAKRTAALTASRAELAAARAEVDGLAKQLAARVKKMNDAAMTQEAAYLVGFTRWVLAEGAQGPPTIDVSRLQRPDRAQVARAAAYATLVSWAMDLHDFDAAAQRQRQVAIDLAGPMLGALDPADSAPEAALLRAAHDLAWDTQIVGAPLTDGRVTARPTASGSR